MANPALKRDMDRWYPLKDHPVQLSLIGAVARGIRFPVVPAGRRSGKTERAKRFIAKEAMKNDAEKYFIAAPTHAQVKKIYWDDMKKFCLTSIQGKKPSETDLIIYMANGTEVHLVGLDKPARFEGIPWTGGVIDEIADIKAGSWEAHIYPALNTVDPTRPDHRAWCWLIGVPDGFNHYYKMANYAESGTDSQWELFHWKSAEILPADVIEAAKKVMSKQQYNIEFNASFENATGRIYPDYSKANLTKKRIKPTEQLWWYHDFNYTPMSSGVGVKRDDGLYLLDEIILTSATTLDSAIEFCDKFKDHKNKHVIIYGDPAGKAGEKHGKQSDYTQMEDYIRGEGWKFTRKVKRSHPAIKDRQNSVRAKICNAAGDVTLFVNPETAPYNHEGLLTVQLQKGSTFQEDDTNEYQHITTAIGYMVDYEFPVRDRVHTIKDLRIAL